MDSNKIAQTCATSLGFFVLLLLGKLAKFSFVIGSYTAFFSINNCIMPLSGAVMGVSGVTILGVAKLFLSLFFGAFSLSHLAFHIPGICAAYYWTSPSFTIRAGVPLFCMFLFIVHPVGCQAWVYAMYWWIPVIIYSYRSTNFFAHALASTFIAHAVGSVIWLYTVPMSSFIWFSLLPIVLIERLLFAFGMVILYRLYQKIMSLRLSTLWVKRAPIV